MQRDQLIWKSVDELLLNKTRRVLFVCLRIYINIMIR